MKKTADNKIKVLFEATLLSNYKGKHSGRSGIFWTAFNLLKVLSHNENLQIYLYSSNSETTQNFINDYSDEVIYNFFENIYDEKKKKIIKILDNDSKKRSIISEIILSKLLKDENIDYKNVDFILKNGKPYIKDSNIYFNISHSYDRIIVCISNKEIGIMHVIYSIYHFI